MTITKEALDHLAGDGIVVKAWYVDPSNPGKADVFTSLPGGEELEIWEDAAFTNGGTLVKLELIWAPDEAAKLQQESDKPSEGLPTAETD